jgi:hypothetical protein
LLILWGFGLLVLLAFSGNNEPKRTLSSRWVIRKNTNLKLIRLIIRTIQNRSRPGAVANLYSFFHLLLLGVFGSYGNGLSAFTIKPFMLIFVKKAIQYFTNLHVFNKETRGRPFVEVRETLENQPKPCENSALISG